MMTPNKLPPLPELDVERARKIAGDRPSIWGCTFDGNPVQWNSVNASGFLHSALDEIERLREALRQSQSLPAGAVAEVTDEQIVRFMEVALRHVEYRRGTYGPSIAEIRQGLHMAGIPALQAGAREKGEAVGELDRSAPAKVWLQIDIDGDNDDRSEAMPRDAWDHLTWHYEPIGGQEVVYIRADLATQPAQASEKGNGRE